MVRLSIKPTYSLDVAAARALEQLARRWNVSKSEALRRAIRASAKEKPKEATRQALLTLNEAQASLLRVSARDAASWEKAARTERRAASRRRKTRTSTQTHNS